MSRIIQVEHLARVEGHGGITVELDGAPGSERVESVRFDVFEGLRLLESLVRGRSFEDVPQVVSRICAICSVAHALTAIEAIEDAFGVEPTAQTLRLRDLLLRGENIESHALHLFLLAAPDSLGFPSAPAMAARFPEAVELGLRLKKLGNLLQETLGGRAIHPVNAVVGGFSRLPSTSDLVALETALEQGRRDGRTALDFLETLPAPDFGGGETVYAALEPPQGYGYRGGREMVFQVGEERRRVPVARLVEEIEERPVRHSHAKHSHYEGMPFMVGALARVTLFGGRLNAPARAAAERLGLRIPSDNPLDNNLAQAVELVHDLEEALATVRELLAAGLAPEAPVPVEPRRGTGTAVIEAPRGLLMHRYELDGDGRVVAANVITPTAANAASVEARFRQVVERETGAPDDDLRFRLERVARAYDPCISCSVHLVRRAPPSG